MPWWYDYTPQKRHLWWYDYTPQKRHFWWEKIPNEERAWKYRIRAESISERTGVTGYEWSAGGMSMTKDGVLTLHRGYGWDGMSFVALDSKDSQRGSAFHDALYRAIRLGLLPGSTRRAADALFRRLNQESGMHPARVWYTWLAVRTFGGLWNRRHLR